jgi:hypothetical protein
VIVVHTSWNQVPSLEYFTVQCIAMENVAEYVIVCTYVTQLKII